MSKLSEIFLKYFGKSTKVDNFSTEETNQQIIHQELDMNEKSQENLDLLLLEEIDDNNLDIKTETSDIDPDYFSIKTI